MLLVNPHDVIAYLVERGACSAAAPLDGNVLVKDLSHRHRNFAITQPGGPSFFLKQGGHGDGAGTVKMEAAIYEFVGQLDRADQLRKHLPRCHDYDPDNDILLLEFHSEAENLWMYHLRRRSYSRTLARALGTSLATIHRLTAVGAVAPDLLARLPDLGSCVIQPLHRPGWHSSLRPDDPARHLIRTLERFPVLGEYLDDLRDDWRGSCLIHRDIKWDNCIACSSTGSRRKTRIKIVDWEFAGLGDPCWDAASVVNDYLHFWLHSVRLDGHQDAEAYVELAIDALCQNPPPIRSFLKAYVKASRLDRMQAVEPLNRIARFLPGKLVETAFKLTHQEGRITLPSAGLLQLAVNIAQAPDMSRKLILGF